MLRWYGQGQDLPDLRHEVLIDVEVDATPPADNHVQIDVSPSWWRRAARSDAHADILPSGLGAAMKSWREHGPEWAALHGGTISPGSLTIDVYLKRSREPDVAPDLESVVAALVAIRPLLLADVEKTWTPPARREASASPE